MATGNLTGVARACPVEWQTIGLIALTYGVLAGLLWFHNQLAWWIILPIGAYFAALHSSLQHEVLHGHPTRKRWLNESLIFITPTFWLPYLSYRETHLKHHNDEHLTCPQNDPESYYLLPETWLAMPGLKRALFIANHTLLGRMLLGPAISMCRFWPAEFRQIAQGNWRTARNWLWFILSCAMAIAIIAASGMPLWKFYVLVSYPGISLALVRSYCEHQAAENIGERTIIVEASGFWSLLFLNNNLHVAHHAKPSLPWYELPRYYRNERSELIAANNGYLMHGYGAIFRAYFLKPKEPIPHPNVDWLRKT